MDELDDVLTRGVKEILPDKKGLEKLLRKEKIKLYLGIDPTAPKLHLGHTVGLRILQQFADLGHEAILLFGTGTVLAGDPSQRDKARKKITKKEIEKNISSWKKQVEPIVDFKKIKIVHNGDWLLDLKLADILKIASNISATQLIKRDMFQKRIKSGGTVWTHEIMYPLLQGYDSVAMDVDLEIGGTDQVFNMLVGRELLKKMAGKNKFVLTYPMISGVDGKQMSKTSGNCIWLEDSPNEMYGKVMGILDEQVISYMTLTSNMPTKKIDEYKKSFKSKKTNPMDAKKELAYNIVLEFHGETKTNEAKKYFKETFQKGSFPKNPFVVERRGSITLQEALLAASKESKSNIKRLINQQAVRVNGVVVTDPKKELKGDEEIKFGKKGFIKIKNNG